ncbi:MAG: phosphoribosylamine--glycine ligase [Deltaproteobacteria bacterium]|jgi:phosphoribosylamine---glycine ligase|nr:phosphoribosylamine--glycine ligase [Deltaproteobacteria bacterium]
MKILVIGSGGREHALIWKIRQSSKVTELYCAPGNVGIADLATCVPINPDNVQELLKFAADNQIDLTVVGPEAPLALGIVDAFKREGLRAFGPTKEAAALESSKSFAKDFCNRYKIPAARSQTFTDIVSAKAYIKGHPLPIVVKADGLAAGKGVIICDSHDKAEKIAEEMLLEGSFGDSGRCVVVEEFLEGEEASFIAICDGNHVLPMVGSQDHKPAYDEDKGPNTGGMGAISPARVLTEEIADKVMNEIMLPAARGMVTEGMPFVGVLYAGLMIKDGEVKVLEFNVRFGDPETQALLARLKMDIVDVFEAAISGTLNTVSMSWDPRPAVCVVMASGGYPGSYEKGKVISGIADANALDDVVVFHAGTKDDSGNVVTNGGRVLGVTALGDDMRSAIAKAYEATEKISWDGVHYRKDIGKKAL